MIRHDTALLKVGDADDLRPGSGRCRRHAGLVELTRPGPFRRRTVELGAFLGIRERGRLVAMAGGMWIGEHREVSGICTHPEAQGRGLARGH
jgi:predicted GNAT family acetyltransferase